MGLIKRVTVFKEDNYYLCQPRELANGKEVFKCGICLRGRINPFGSKKNQDYKCRVCGAELKETITGVGWHTKIYSP